MTKKTPTQCDLVLAYMKNHLYITSLGAYRDLGVTQLGARIYELKKKGYKIGKQRKRNAQNGKHFDKYFLMED